MDFPTSSVPEITNRPTPRGTFGVVDGMIAIVEGALVRSVVLAGGSCIHWMGKSVFIYIHRKKTAIMITCIKCSKMECVYIYIYICITTIYNIIIYIYIHTFTLCYPCRSLYMNTKQSLDYICLTLLGWAHGPVNGSTIQMRNFHQEIWHKKWLGYCRNIQEPLIYHPNIVKYVVFHWFPCIFSRKLGVSTETALISPTPCDVKAAAMQL